MKKKNLIALLHLAVIVAILVSPFVFSWKAVLAGVALYYVQLYFIGGCVLTKAQFGNTEEGFYAHYLQKLGLHFSSRQIGFVVDWVLPPLILSIAVMRQIKLIR